MRLRFSVAVLAVVVLAGSACAEGTPESSSEEPATTTVPAVPSDEASTTTAAPPVSATSSSGGGTTGVLSAAESLGGFFDAAEELDVRIRAAAGLFDAGFDPEAGTVGEDAVAAIDALDAESLGELIPGGLTVELETAVLAVFAGLDSRVAALHGGTRYARSLEEALVCLGAGGDSADRFPRDLLAARDLASGAPPPMAAPDSPEAGMLAARLVYIRGSNWCCDSCGGFTYDTPIPVDWEARILSPGEIGAPFEVTFDGEHWQVVFPYAG